MYILKQLSKPTLGVLHSLFACRLYIYMFNLTIHFNVHTGAMRGFMMTEKAAKTSLDHKNMQEMNFKKIYFYI